MLYDSSTHLTKTHPQKLMKVAKLCGDMTSSEFASRYFEKDSKDGMQSWANILAENFKELGGDLKLNSYVDKIITKNGTAVGVSCKGATYEADHVISAGDYKKTFLKLIDDKTLIPKTLRSNIERASVSEGYFTVYLGLNMTNGELGKYMKVPHVFVFCKPGCDFYNSADREFFSKPSAEVSSPSMVNSEHAPEGKSSLMLQTKAPYHWMNNWGNGDRKTNN